MYSRMFHYRLPREMIAQSLTRPRDMCRLLIYRHPSETLHLRFRDLPRVLPPRPVIVLNRTRVIPAKLELRRRSGGRVEALIVNLGDSPDGPRAYLRGRIREGERLLGEEGVRLEVERHVKEGLFEVRVSREGQALWGEELLGLLRDVGRVPAPPYIRRRDLGEEDYQTVYATSDGSVAAPTAGLHFTPELLKELAGQGALISYIELNVGPGTFLPVRSEVVEEHKMEEERFFIPPDEAERINRALEEGRPLVAVGTTTVRALESAASSGRVRGGEGLANVFIHPPYSFSLPYSAFITNFHLPLSTPLLLLSSFIPWERVYRLYMEALSRGYRFYSLGDAMLIHLGGGAEDV